jgi:hypothetical protein
MVEGASATAVTASARSGSRKTANGIWLTRASSASSISASSSEASRKMR